MKFKKTITKKIACFILIAIISFVSILNVKVYASSTDPTPLVPKDNQYIELRAVTVKELDGKDYQLIMQVWAHNLKMKGFTFRIQFDNSVMKPSSLEANEYSEENSEEDMTFAPEYFKFENGLENNMDATGYYKDGTLQLFISLLPDEYMTATNPYIGTQTRSRNNIKFRSNRWSINR